MKENPLFIIIDLFCGFGGTTTGFDQAMYVDRDGHLVQACKVVACVNHDPKAIKSHWLNHPEVKHFEEDIRTLDLTELKAIVKRYRKLYPDAYIILWASLECTNFSKAKGGMPRSADSRTLAEHLPRYITALDPHFIQIENVVEFMSWGPLDDNGKPISRKNGSDWLKWREGIREMGYHDDWKEINSADFGAYTSRNRLFGCYAKHGLPIVWPAATHAKNPAKVGLFGQLEKWKPVKDVLDFEDEGKSIFNRKIPLSEKTLERNYAGLIKFVAHGDTSFISKYYSGKPQSKNISVDGPAGTVTTIDGQALVQADFHSEFLASYYSTGNNVSPVTSPSPTLPTKDRLSLVLPQYFANRNNQSIDSPAGSILPVDKHSLIETQKFIMPTNYDNGPKSIEDPAPTITANRKHHYLVNPAFNNPPGSIENPCFTLVAVGDKKPLSLVSAYEGSYSIAIYEDDSPCTVKIKQFMAAYGLVDVKMRMLRVSELLKIQGFPEGYKMVGNQTDQKKFIGNSVHPLVPKYLAEAMAEKLTGYSKQLKAA